MSKETRAQHPLVASALESLTIHPRIDSQGITPDPKHLEALVASVPPLTPFKDREYKRVRAVLDWDHCLPSEMMVLRIYCAHDESDGRLLDLQFKKRAAEIAQDDLYPEFDLPDYGEFEASEYYVATIEVDTWALDDFRFFADWRREIRGTTSRAALSAVRKRDLYRKAYAQRANDALGGAVVVGWAPPAVAHSEDWAIEVWLVTDFDGAAGRALVFMVDVRSHEVTREYQTEIHIA